MMQIARQSDMITAELNKKSDDISDNAQQFQNYTDNKINDTHAELNTIINEVNEYIEQLTINNAAES